MQAWALLDEKGAIVHWRCMTDDEEGLEIHRTRDLARRSRMTNERVVKVEIAVIRPESSSQ